jgi:hypothetical protein
MPVVHAAVRIRLKFNRKSLFLVSSSGWVGLPAFPLPRVFCCLLPKKIFSCYLRIICHKSLHFA